MDQYLQPLMEYLRFHPYIGILFAFAIAFIESLPVLGTLFPGSITMTAIGALIGASVLPPIATCILAILGALAGDCLGFFLGNKYHQQIRSIWPINKIGKYIDYSERFFEKHGGKSIVIGRFIGPTRAAMPMIAGILRFTWSQFLPSALLAAILWSLVYMAPGIILGALAMEFPRGDMTKVFFLGLAVIAGLWLVFWILQFFFKQLSRGINQSIQTWWNRMVQPKPGLLVKILVNPQHLHDFHQLKILLIFIITSIGFLLLWWQVIHHGTITQINSPIFYLLQSFRRPWVNHISTLLTVIAGPQALILASLLTAAGLILCKQWRAGILLAFLGTITAGAIEFFKKIHFNPRPSGFVWVDPSSSFPSGHTTLSVVVIGFVAFLTGKLLSGQWRRISYFLFILLIFLISLSRIILGQHWFSDILGGWLLGLSLLLLVILIFRRFPSNLVIYKIKPERWMAIITIGTLLPCAIAGIWSYQKTFYFTQPIWPIIRISLSEWWSHPTEYTSIYRQDRFGRIAQPFNVQWAGDINNIQLFLLNRGWQIVNKPLTLKSTLQRFSSLQPEFHAPLLPWQYHNQEPAAFFIKHLNPSADILELRLWQSEIQFTDSTMPLWFGILIYHTPAEKILKFPRRYMHLQSGNVLIDLAPQFNKLQSQLIHIPFEQQPKAIRNIHWDGNIYILLISNDQ